MIRFISHQQIEKVKWDACITTSQNSLIYACSWYLDLVSPGWCALVLDDYAAVFPLTEKRKFGIHFLTQPFFCQQLGIFSSEIISPSMLIAFLNSIPRKYLWYDIHLNNFYGQFAPFLQSRKKMYPRFSYELSLSSGYSAIFQNYSANHKTNLRKARKNNLRIREINPAQVIQLYRKFIGNKTPEIKLTDYKRLHCLMLSVLEKKKAICLGAFDNNVTPGAAAFFLIHHERIIFLFGGCTLQGRRDGAMRLLMDDVIQRYCGQNFVLDFEGSSVPSVEYFYKGFGAEKKFFLRYCYSGTKILELLNDVRMKRNALRNLISKRFKSEATLYEQALNYSNALGSVLKRTL